MEVYHLTCDISFLREREMKFLKTDRKNEIINKLWDEWGLWLNYLFYYEEDYTDWIKLSRILYPWIVNIDSGWNWIPYIG